MPNYVQLLDKTTKTPEAFPVIDDKIRVLFDAPEDTKCFFHSWYDNLAMLLSVGKSFDELREIWKDDPKMIRITDFLEENYTVDAWYSHNKY